MSWRNMFIRSGVVYAFMVDMCNQFREDGRFNGL